MDCEFQKRERERKRLPNELLQNALKKKKKERKQLLCWAEQHATYHFCIKKEISLFSFW